jgi:hypothetical protein
MDYATDRIKLHEKDDYRKSGVRGTHVGEGNADVDE